MTVMKTIGIAKTRNPLRIAGNPKRNSDPLVRIGINAFPTKVPEAPPTPMNADWIPRRDGVNHRERAGLAGTKTAADSTPIRIRERTLGSMLGRESVKRMPPTEMRKVPIVKVNRTPHHLSLTYPNGICMIAYAQTYDEFTHPRAAELHE